MSTGAICVNTLKKDWTPSVKISHVLSVIRCLLIVPFPESSLNDEAGKLFMESYEEYARRAELMANVHGRPQSYSENMRSSPGSPIKYSKENENRNDMQNCPNLKTTSLPSSSAVLKQSNSVDVHANDGKKSTTKVSGKGGDKKSKKKSLKRL
jgi:ubiquitin-conjugating enzyme E2 S